MASMTSSTNSPQRTIILCAFILVNTLAAFINHIDDTDEVFGYYEPLHYLLYNYSGMQTWEYAPQYALRSYAFLTPLWFIGKICINFTTLSKIELFTTLRVSIGILFALCETNLIIEVMNSFGENIGLINWILFLISPGMLYCSTSFLPSAFCASFVMLATSSWLRNDGLWTVFWGSLAAIFTGWPFCCLLFIPYGIHLLLVQPSLLSQLIFSLKGLIILIIVLSVCTVIDARLYGRNVSPLLNILRYNAIGGRGDELYGTEPFAYYIRNLFLTLNICWPLGMICPILLIRSILQKYQTNKNIALELQQGVVALPVILWLAILFQRPHKEERFLYPVYPLLIVLAAVSIEHLCDLFVHIVISKTNKKGRKLVIIFTKSLCILTAALLGVSRIASNYNNFHGYIHLWTDVSRVLSSSTKGKAGVMQTVCIGSDWYTFPSHFFLPHKTRLEFIRDGFGGQLPYHFAEINGTSTQPIQPFNDQNLEEASRYVELSACNYVVLHLHRQGKDGNIEAFLRSMSGQFVYETSTLVLDAQNSPALTRAFYIPWKSIEENKYNEYSMFEVNVKPSDNNWVEEVKHEQNPT